MPLGSLRDRQGRTGVPFTPKRCAVWLDKSVTPELQRAFAGHVAFGLARDDDGACTDAFAVIEDTCVTAKVICGVSLSYAPGACTRHVFSLDLSLRAFADICPLKLETP